MPYSQTPFFRAHVPFPLSGPALPGQYFPQPVRIGGPVLIISRLPGKFKPQTAKRRVRRGSPPGGPLLRPFKAGCICGGRRTPFHRAALHFSAVFMFFPDAVKFWPAALLQTGSRFLSSVPRSGPPGCEAFSLFIPVCRIHRLARKEKSLRAADFALARAGQSVCWNPEGCLMKQAVLLTACLLLCACLLPPAGYYEGCF